jgi:WD40 repeat protein
MPCANQLLWRACRLLQVLQHIPPSGGGDKPGSGHSAAVLCVSAHPTQPLLASAGHDPDNTVKIWSAEDSA